MRTGYRQYSRGHSTSLAALPLLFALCSFNLWAQSQTPTDKTPAPAPPATRKGHQGGALHIVVVDSTGNPLDRQALIRLHSVLQDTTNWQTTSDNSQTLVDDLLFGNYQIEASALGYLSSNAQINVHSVDDIVELKMTLQRDPLIVIEETDASLPTKTVHELHRAIRALNTNDLAEAQRRLEEAVKLSPSSARVKYLLGYLYFAKGDYPQAQTALIQATTIDKHYLRALNLLGRIYLLRGQHDDAIATLEQAVAVSPDNPTAQELLADVYLQQHEYEKAREHAEQAIVHGDGEQSSAQLAMAEARASLGKTVEAIQSSKTFLNAHGKSAGAPHAQDLLKKLERAKSKPGDASFQAVEKAAAFNLSTDLLASPKLDLPPTSWLPAGIDRDKPSVATAVSCPERQVIDGAGDRVMELVTNVQKFAAIESIVYERRDPMGSPNYSETHKFDYAAAVSPQKDVVLVDEYRVQRYDMDTLPDRIVDNGFAVLALVFHPVMRDGFQMTCEGLGDLHGKPTWMVRFQQREDRPNHMQAYLVGTVRYPVSLKGRAWINPDTLQIVRIESDMVRPMPLIELLAEHTVTEYSPVPFARRSTEYWLPQSAEVYMYFRGQRYYRKHTFEKYMLFSVEAEDKVHEAKHDPEVQAPADPQPPAAHDPS